jgi:hypothetical protein
MDAGDSRAVNIWNGRSRMGSNILASTPLRFVPRDCMVHGGGKTVTMGTEALEICAFGDALNCTGPHAVDARFLAQAHAGSAEDLRRFSP